MDTVKILIASTATAAIAASPLGSTNPDAQQTVSPRNNRSIVTTVADWDVPTPPKPLVAVTTETHAVLPAAQTDTTQTNLAPAKKAEKVVDQDVAVAPSADNTLEQRLAGVQPKQPALVGNRSKNFRGNSTGTVQTSVPAIPVAPPISVSGGSSGGNTVSPLVTTGRSWTGSSSRRSVAAQASPSPVKRVASSIRSQIIEPVVRRRVVMHTFANQSCRYCDSWMANEAPKLCVAGVVVEKVADLTAGLAPTFEVFRGGNSRGRLRGYQRAKTLLSPLQ